MSARGNDVKFRPLPRMAALLVLFLAVQWTASPPLSAAFKRVSRGDTPPPFTLADLDGKERTSAELLTDGVTVIVFWSTWSPRSMEILEDLEKLRQGLAPKVFQVVAINGEHEIISAADRQAIEKISKDLSLTAVMLLDQGLVAYNSYGAMALPSSLVVDGGGKVVFDLAGYPTTMRSDLSDAVKKALGLPTSVELRPPEGYKAKNGALMYYNFGKRLMEKGQEEKGEAQLLTAVERDPEFVKPRVMLGIYFKKTGRLDDALEQFRTVRELDPGSEEASYEAGAVSLRGGKFDEAETFFAEMHEEFPEREEFALGLALAHKYRGRDDVYESLKKKADSLLPAAARIHYELGAVAEAQGDLSLAAELYRRALGVTLSGKRYR